MTHRTTSVQCLLSGSVKPMLNRGRVELEGKIRPLKSLQKHQKFCVPNLLKEVPFQLFKNLTAACFYSPADGGVVLIIVVLGKVSVWLIKVNILISYIICDCVSFLKNILLIMIAINNT